MEVLPKISPGFPPEISAEVLLRIGQRALPEISPGVSYGGFPDVASNISLIKSPRIPLGVPSGISPGLPPMIPPEVSFGIYPGVPPGFSPEVPSFTSASAGTLFGISVGVSHEIHIIGSSNNYDY